MSNARIKNLILLILALAVCFLLLAVVPGKLSARQERDATEAQLTELFASYGVTLEADVLQAGEALYAVELGESDLTGAAQALLGSDVALQDGSTRYESTYRAATGAVSFHRSGALDAALQSPVQGKSPEADLLRRLRGMGYTAWKTEPGLRQTDDGYLLSVQQSLLGVPVFGSRLTFTYQEQTLCAVEGLFYPETGTISRTSEQSCISCADALTQILASRDATGWVGSSITGAQQGYLHAETATAALRFVPVWRVETDTATFYVNGITREVRQAEQGLS